jgi:PLP dependent protein
VNGDVLTDVEVAAERIAERLREVERRIADAAVRVGRRREEVTIIGVTKTHPGTTVRAALAAGLRQLGENRAGDLHSRAEVFPEATWHFVGQLQSNKVRRVLGRAALIHSVDRRSLVDALELRAARAGVSQRVLVQVNIGDDPAKGGCPPEQTEDLVERVAACGSLVVEGLMTIPPLPPEDSDQAAHVQPMFASLRRVRDHVRERYPQVRELSMGMSADFEEAVMEGATMVRLGTALFGPRQEQAGTPDE